MSSGCVPPYSKQPPCARMYHIAPLPPPRPHPQPPLEQHSLSQLMDGRIGAPTPEALHVGHGLGERPEEKKQQQRQENRTKKKTTDSQHHYYLAQQTAAKAKNNHKTVNIITTNNTQGKKTIQIQRWSISQQQPRNNTTTTKCGLQTRRERYKTVLYRRVHQQHYLHTGYQAHSFMYIPHRVDTE